jgi:hypothetical protein
MSLQSIVKIVKNELEARKLWASKVENRFYRKFWTEQFFIAYFQSPSKIFKYYSVAVVG